MCHFLKLGWLSPLSSYVTTLFTLLHWDTQADQKILQKGTARFFLFEPLQKHQSPFPQRWGVLSLNVKSADWLEFPPFWSTVFTLLADNCGWLLAICLDPDQTAPIHRLGGCACWSCLCWSQMSLCWFSPDFISSLLGFGEWKIAKLVVVHQSRWLSCSYMTKTFKKCFYKIRIHWSLTFLL